MLAKKTVKNQITLPMSIVKKTRPRSEAIVGEFSTKWPPIGMALFPSRWPWVRTL